MKQNAVVIIGGIIAVDIYSNYRQNGRTKKIVIYGTAVLLYAALIIAFLVRLGIWNDFTDQVFIYNQKSGNPLDVVTDQSTRLISSTGALIEPEFNAVVSTGEFVIKIQPCNNSASSARDSDLLNRPNIDVTQFPAEEFESGQKSFHIETKEIIEGITVSEKIKVYPNPAYDKVNIDICGNKGEKLKVRLVNNLAV